MASEYVILGRNKIGPDYYDLASLEMGSYHARMNHI